MTYNFKMSGWKLLSAAAAFVLTTGTVQLAQADGWGGGYVGAHAGYATTNLDIDDFPVGLPEGDGFVGGIHGGYNIQSGNLVYGFEVDGSFGDVEDTKDFAFDDEDGDPVEGSLKVSNEYLASIRGRIGYASDTALFYATAGVAWAGAEVTGTSSVTYFNGLATVTEEESIKLSASDTGYVVGGGAAMKFTPKISARVEGLYYDFGEEDDADYSFTSVRGGLTFHLN